MIISCLHVKIKEAFASCNADSSAAAPPSLSVISRNDLTYFVSSPPFLPFPFLLGVLLSCFGKYTKVDALRDHETRSRCTITSLPGAPKSKPSPVALFSLNSSGPVENLMTLQLVLVTLSTVTKPDALWSFDCDALQCMMTSAIIWHSTIACSHECRGNKTEKFLIS